MNTKTLIALLITGTICQFSTGIDRARAADAPPLNTLQVIQQKIRSEVAARLAEAGAGYADIQVTVAVKRDSATPFKVTYRGLHNFTGSDGTTPQTDGEFIMNYIGGGQWQGALAGTQFIASVGTKDNIDLPFVNDGLRLYGGAAERARFFALCRAELERRGVAWALVSGTGEVRLESALAAIKARFS